jgi:hypothetical protein
VRRRQEQHDAQRRACKKGFDTGTMHAPPVLCRRVSHADSV